MVIFCGGFVLNFFSFLLSFLSYFIFPFFLEESGRPVYKHVYLYVGPPGMGVLGVLGLEYCMYVYMVYGIYDFLDAMK